MQVRASLRRNGSETRVRHIVELLDESYGLSLIPISETTRPY